MATIASKELSLLAKGFLTAAFFVAGAAASVAAMAVFVVAVLALVVLVVGTGTGAGVLVRDDALVVVGAFPAIGNVVGHYGRSCSDWGPWIFKLGGARRELKANMLVMNAFLVT